LSIKIKSRLEDYNTINRIKNMTVSAFVDGKTRKAKLEEAFILSKQK